MSNLGQGVFDQGVEKGRTEGQLEMIRKIMKKLNLNLEQTLQFLEVPKEQYEIYAVLLKDKV